MQVAATDGGCEVENRNGRAAMIKKVDQVARAADVPAKRANRLRKRAHLNVDAPVHPEMINRTAPVACPRTPEACASSTIMIAPYFSANSHRPGSAPMSPSMEKTPSVISSLWPGLIFHAGELLFGVSEIFVIEDQNLRARKPRAVDDRRVIELVGDDEIFFAEKCRNRAGVGGESRLKDDAGFDVLEARNLLFQFHVNAHGAGDGAHGAGADSDICA